MKYKLLSVIFIVFLLNVASAQSSRINSFHKYIAVNEEHISDLNLKSADLISNIIDSAYVFNWDSVTGSWIADSRNLYAADQYGQITSKNTDLFDYLGLHPYPYSLEQRSYYTNGRLKEQTNSYWDNLLGGFQARTRYVYNYNMDGNITDLYLYNPGGTTGWYCTNHYHQVFNKYNNLTEYYEYYSNDPADKPELTRKQFTCYNEFGKISYFYDSILDNKSNKFICNELEQYRYDTNGQETEFYLWFRFTPEDPLELIQKIETSYNMNDRILTKTHYSRDTVKNTWFPTGRTSETYDLFWGRIIESKGSVWNELTDEWLPTYWNTTTYRENFDYDTLMIRTWNNDQHQYEYSIKYVNTYNESNSLIEHALYEWKQGWKYIETTTYNYDAEDNININILKSWNETDSALRNTRKWETYYSAKNVDNIVYDTTPFKIAPNPAINIIYVINTKPGTVIDIYDIEGKKTPISIPYSGYYQAIDISSLPAGIYLVKATSNGKSLYRKFIKQDQSF